MKNSMYASLILVFLCSCGDNEMKTSPVQEQNTRLTRQMFALFNRHQWDSMAMLYSNKCEFLDPSLGKKPVNLNRKEHSAHHRRLSDMSPDILDEVIGIYPSGDKTVVVEFISSGTANGYKWSLPLCNVLNIENGLIIKDHVYYDRSD